MSIHEQRIVLRILESCQAELKGVKLKDYAGTTRKFEHGLWDVDAQMHVSDVCLLYTSPYTGTGHPEQLKYLQGVWSRQLDKKNRIRYTAVSYTHLDVYKRQDIR